MLSRREGVGTGENQGNEARKRERFEEKTRAILNAKRKPQQHVPSKNCVS